MCYIRMHANYSCMHDYVISTWVTCKQMNKQHGPGLHVVCWVKGKQKTLDNVDLGFRDVKKRAAGRVGQTSTDVYSFKTPPINS